jgi:hypothetical protein
MKWHLRCSSAGITKILVMDEYLPNPGILCSDAYPDNQRLPVRQAGLAARSAARPCSPANRPDDRSGRIFF